MKKNQRIKNLNVQPDGSFLVTVEYEMLVTDRGMKNKILNDLNEQDYFGPNGEDEEMTLEEAHGPQMATAMAPAAPQDDYPVQQRKKRKQQQVEEPLVDAPEASITDDDDGLDLD